MNTEKRMDKALVNEELEKRKFLMDLLKKSRKEYPNSISFIDSLITKLEVDPEFHQKFVTEVSTIFKDINFVRYLTTSGLMQENTIFSLLRFKVMNIILPEIDNNGTLSSIINEIFYDAKTFKWFRGIPKDRWERFFTIFFQNYNEAEKNQIIKKIRDQLIESLDILMDKVGGGFSDDEMMRYRPEGNYDEIPFNELSKEIHSIIYNPEKPYDQLAIRQIIRSSLDYLDDILMQRDEKGISLKITVKIKRVVEELTRAQAILRNLTELKSENGLVNFFTNATNSWPEYYSPRNWISKQISSNVYLITFLATYHNGKTGEHYITSTQKEYNKMFMTAVGGGLIVAICCYVKAWMHNMETISLFTKTFLYCINYAVGFAAIYLTHMTLATKQPSMTASLIAHTLIKEEGKKKLISVSSQSFLPD